VHEVSLKGRECDSGAAIPLAQGSQDLIIFRESAALCLAAEDVGAVGKDVEHPARTGDQARLVAEGLLDRGRQTGGPWLVVSLRAVGDGDVHGVTSVTIAATS